MGWRFDLYIWQICDGLLLNKNTANKNADMFTKRVIYYYDKTAHNHVHSKGETQLAAHCPVISGVKNYHAASPHNI